MNLVHRIINSVAPELTEVPTIRALEERSQVVQSDLLAMTADLHSLTLDTRHAVQSAREDVAHLRGSVDELRREMGENVAHIRGDIATLAERNFDNRLGILRELVARVEHYQPIYGLAGIIEDPARPSIDRARIMESALGEIQGKRVLDLGSSLGYFTMYLSDRGAIATGWDFKPDNIAISRLASDITGGRATFLERSITLEAIKQFENGEYDVVLALSIFHHLTAFEGVAYTQKLVEELVARVPVLIVELAEKGEDASLYWNESQPENQLEIFETVRNDVQITLLGRHGTHLSTNARSLYLIRRKKTVEVGSRSFAFDSEQVEAYRDAPIKDAKAYRRYYMSEQFVVKQYWFHDSRPENWRQIISELNFFTAVLPLSSVYRAPDLVAHEISTSTAKLAFSRTVGDLLDECESLTANEVDRIVIDVLRSLSDLRDIGLHHNDVRSWNIISNIDGGWLIDYGLCGPVSYDDDAVSLLWAASAALTGTREPYGSDRQELPDQSVFVSPMMALLYAAVLNGTNDPRELLLITRSAI